MGKESYNIGNCVIRKGFFTKRKFIETALAGDGYYEVEKRVGYHQGRLSQGFYLAQITVLPLPHEFEMRGYSNVAGHHFSEGSNNIVFNRDDAQIFAAHINLPVITEYVLKELKTTSKQEIIVSRELLKWYVYKEWETDGGARNLVKILPVTEHSNFLEDDYQYPIGTGIPQWELTNAKYFKIYKILENRKQELMII